MLRPTITLVVLLATASAAPRCGGGGGVALDPAYAPDHQNYICMNYTRSVPLPCEDAAKGWEPRWYDKATGKPRFIIYAWWPPANADLDAYAAAGFNLALTGNAIMEYCNEKLLVDPNASVTHDEIFDVNVRTSERFAKRGILTVFETENGCNALFKRGPTVAYGNRTGGVIQGHTNLTARAPDATFSAGSRAFSKGQTIPELEYITAELVRRGVADRFGGVQIHDDTLTQTGEDIGSTAWLKANAPWLVPLVNQVSGNTGPQTLYRSGLFMSAPEQYPINCPDANCSAINASAAALAQMNAYAGNAVDDARFGLHHWPLFHVGDGGSKWPGDPNPDNGTTNVRSDSLVRWMAYAAIAYGAKGLNWYCWGHGVWWINANNSLPGRPSPIYQTVVEVNADAAAWGDELLGGGFGFSGALHTGFAAQNGGGAPSARLLGHPPVGRAQSASVSR